MRLNNNKLCQSFFFRHYTSLYIIYLLALLEKVGKLDSLLYTVSKNSFVKYIVLIISSSSTWIRSFGLAALRTSYKLKNFSINNSLANEKFPSPLCFIYIILKTYLQFGNISSLKSCDR